MGDSDGDDAPTGSRLVGSFTAPKDLLEEAALAGQGDDDDPFKDTSGPSLNILIKLMSVFSLTLAPIFRGDWRTWWEGLVMMGVSLLIIFIAFYYIVVKGEQAEPERREMPSEKKATSV